MIVIHSISRMSKAVIHSFCLCISATGPSLRIIRIYSLGRVSIKDGNPIQSNSINSIKSICKFSKWTWSRDIYGVPSIWVAYTVIIGWLGCVGGSITANGGVEGDFKIGLLLWDSWFTSEAMVGKIITLDSDHGLWILNGASDTQFSLPHTVGAASPSYAGLHIVACHCLRREVVPVSSHCIASASVPEQLCNLDAID